MEILKKQKQIPNDLIEASRKHFYGECAPHIHEFFEIEYVIDGSGICEIDGQKYPMRKGSLFLLNPANTHAIRSADVELINVMFRCEYSDEFFSLPLLYSSVSPMFSLDGQNGDLVFLMLSELVSVHKENIRYARLLLECVLQKLAYDSSTRSRELLPYIQHAFLYITEHFRNGITLESTAAHLGLTPTYFSDLFVKETGINFKTYLDDVRFSHAKNLLTFTEIPICEVHRYSGFGDYANFSRRFKRLFGSTPGEYRRHKAQAAPPSADS